MDALPWADVNASFAHDAFTLVDMNELLWLNSPAQIVGIDLDELILSRPLRHGWVGVGACHEKSGLPNQGTAVGRRCDFF